MTAPSIADSFRIPGLSPTYCGKVRDVYDLGDMLVIVATDRISAFDVIFNEPVPDKGRILTQMSVFWFREFSPFRNIIANHCLEIDVTRFPAPFRDHADLLRDRAMLVRKAARVDYECVVRGYLSGSAWKEYRAAGTVNGMPIASGLVESSRLPSPIFTPATKAATGHDENVPFAVMEKDLGPDLSERLRAVAVALYQAAADHAETRGLILADTKFEFGRLADGDLLLIDEAVTPDSSRYWSQAEFAPGKPQDSFDKQFVRDYLETLQWNKLPPPPCLPARVIEGTRAKYREAYHKITGREFS